MAYATLDHITNARAAARLQTLRNEFSGISKTYGVRYLRALAALAGFTYDEWTHITTNKMGVAKQHPSHKAAGIYIENIIDDRYDLGVY